MVAALRSRRPATIAQSLYNGLEGVAAARHPAVGQMEAALLAAGALGAAMSGSGLTVFGVARSLDHARQIRGRVARASWECWAVRTLAGPAIRGRGECEPPAVTRRTGAGQWVVPWGGGTRQG